MENHRFNINIDDLPHVTKCNFSDGIYDVIKYIGKDLDNAVLDLLRKNGYKPRLTETYFKNIGKKLFKNDTFIQIKPVSELKDGTWFTMGYEVSLVKLEGMYKAHQNIKRIKGAKIFKLPKLNYKEIKNDNG